MDDQVFFRRWKDWFLQLVHQEVFKANGFRPMGEGMYLRLGPGPSSSDEFFRESKNEARFLKGFRRLCAEFGLDSSLHDACKADGEKSVGRKLKTARFDDAFARRCCLFDAQLTALLGWQGAERKSDLVDLRQEESKFPEIPVNVSFAIICILERMKGRGDCLMLVKKFFGPRGELDRWAKKIIREHGRIIFDHNSGQFLAESVAGGASDGANFERVSFILPVFLEIITRARGANEGTQWANHWKEQLLKTAPPGKTAAVIAAEVERRFL